jgi:hypothetical protein
MSFMVAYAGISFVSAAVWALRATNIQARLARLRMFEDEDGRIAEAARAWRPGPRWVALPKYRRRRAAAEAALRQDPVLWARYERLRDELVAWNDLESSVAIALPAAVIVYIASL